MCPVKKHGGVIKPKAHLIAVSALSFVFCLSIGCSEPLTKREQGGLLGAGLGAGTGAIIGSTVGHAAVGALTLIGGPVGLIGGALIGDQLMGQDKTQEEQQRQIDQNAKEIDRLRNKTNG